MATQTKKAKETKLLTARELAGLQDNVHGHPLESRDSHVRLRRTQNDIFKFNRAEYRFNPNDAVTKQIIARAKALKESPPEPQKESNTEPQQNS
jgi:hypothetical protein